MDAALQGQPLVPVDAGAEGYCGRVNGLAHRDLGLAIDLGGSTFAMQPLVDASELS